MDGQPPHSRSENAAPRPIAAQSTPKRTRLVALAKLALALGLLAWLCTDRLDLRSLTAVSPSPTLGLLAAMLLASMLLPALRWWWLLRIQQIDATPWQAVKLTWSGYLAALILPGAVSGDVAKSYLIVRHCPAHRGRSLSTVLVDRLIGVYSLLLLGALSAAALLATDSVDGQGKTLAWTVVALLAGTTVAATALVAGPWRRIAEPFVPSKWSQAWRDSGRLYWQAKRALAGCLAISLVSSMLTAAAFTVASRVLQEPVAWSSSLSLGPLVVLANCLPITPGGMGVAEAAASELFQQRGSVHGAEMMLLIRVLMATLSLPALLVLLGRRGSSISSTPIDLRPADASPRHGDADADLPNAA
ncbi:MAG: flippase-like domain-containing protein [Planctomycetales bacterium]|nr:flippase-like domain-containing protein [Planctomycetales bacterium]